jgi:hypothetical protein
MGERILLRTWFSSVILTLKIYLAETCFHQAKQQNPFSAENRCKKPSDETEGNGKLDEVVTAVPL